MSNPDLIIQSIGTTQFKVEKCKKGLWSGGPEICIAHFLDSKRSRTNPSIPLDQVPELIDYLKIAYDEMMKEKSVQS